MALNYGDERDRSRYSVDEWNLAEFYWQVTHLNEHHSGREFCELTGRQQEPFIEDARKYLRGALNRFVGVEKIEQAPEPEVDLIVAGYREKAGAMPESHQAYGRGLIAGMVGMDSDVVAQVIKQVPGHDIWIAAAVVKK